MKSFSRVLLLSVAAVLLYDGLMSLASRQFGFDYGSPPVMAGSALIYAAAGYFGARVRGKARAGMLAGALTGLADSTLGWLLSSLILLGTVMIGATPLATALVVSGMIVLITILGAVCGLIGGMIGRRR